MKPVRKGRFSDVADWKEQYRRKVVTSDDAASLVKDGDSIASCGGANYPQVFEKALIRRALDEDLHVEWYAAFQVKKPEIAAYPDHFKMYSYFFGAERPLYADNGFLGFTPVNLSDCGKCIAARRPRIVIASCTPPDENGWMSRSLWGAHIDRDNFDDPDCELLIVEINEKLPRIHSEGECHTLIHVSEADYITENAYEWNEVLSAEPSETDRRIAEYVAELIPDGSCIQIGMGGLADAVGDLLRYAGKKHLGLHTEVLTNCIAGLMKDGIIDNSRKQLCRGRSVASQIVGDRNLWKFCDGNAELDIREVKWVNNMANIARNDNVVSVNNAMEIDLTGQTASESIGPVQYSGCGGQLEWVMGAQMSENGKSLIALKSAYKGKDGKLHSKIRSELSRGSIVTTPRQCIQYVVTEYGIVDLRYKSTAERANLLISIAHPEFRESLKRDMRKTLGFV